MQIVPTAPTATGYGRPAPLAADRAPVPIEPVAAPRPKVAASAARRITGDAALLAHLWAIRENAPQTRARRRAAPGTAREAYARADALADTLADTLAMPRAGGRLV